MVNIRSESCLRVNYKLVCGCWYVRGRLNDVWKPENLLITCYILVMNQLKLKCLVNNQNIPHVKDIMCIIHLIIY